jgi:hypothetical protein
VIKLDNSLGVEKALVYSNISLWESQFVVTAEIINELYKNKIQVHWLKCVGSLSACPANPLHNLQLCKTCIKRSSFFTKQLVPDQVKIHDIDPVADYNVSDFSSQFEFEQFIYKNMPAGKLAYSQLVDDASDTIIPLSLLNTKGKALIRDAVSLFEQTTHLILIHSIDIVFVWNGRRSSDGPVLYAAKNLKKRAICYSSGGSVSKYFLQENSLHSVHEWTKSIGEFRASTCLTNEGMELESRRFYNGQKFGGQTNFDHSYFGQSFEDEYEEDVGSQKKILAFFTTSNWETVNFDDRANLPEDFKDSYKVIENVLGDDSISEKYKIIIRWHPNLVNAGAMEKAKIKKIIQKYPQVIHYLPESGINSYSLLEKSSVVVTTGSTIGIEATYYGKVSILLGFSTYQNMGACYIPASHSDFRDLVLSNPLPLEKSGSHLYGAFLINYGSEFQKFEYRGGQYVLKSSPGTSFLQQSRLVHIRRNRYFKYLIALISTLR